MASAESEGATARLAPAGPPPDRRRWALAALGLVAIIGLSVTLTVMASRRTSTTFDEIVLIAGGARGLHVGSFELTPDHPPLMQYIYGLPAFLSHPNYPDETRYGPDVRAKLRYRYTYAQQFFWSSGNDPETLAALGRAPAALFVALLVVLAFCFVANSYGAMAGLLAAALAGFLPDVLAHGGVAYNDLPLATLFLAGLWAFDAAARRPSASRGLVAGTVIGVALAIKVSGILLIPAAGLILAAEADARFRDARWRRAVIRAMPLVGLAAWAVLAIAYRGDWSLEGLREAIAAQVRHSERGQVAGEAFLLGDRSLTGWWYFFPVAFVFKTSVGLQLLLLLAVFQHARNVRKRNSRALQSPLRAPVIGLIVIGSTLVTSNLNIGFRHALPALPLLVVITAAGVTSFWASATLWPRLGIAAAALWATGFVAAQYPAYLSFISEFGPGRDRGHEVLVDSSLDWGQGLLELRDFLRDEGNPTVYLSYFGSALPGGYGIECVPLPSFFRLPPPASTATSGSPAYLVVSATHLQGVYLDDDAFAPLREIVPDRLLGRTLLVYSWPRVADTYIGHFVQGWIAEQEKRHVEARDHFQTALQLRPAEGLARFHLGTVQLQLGDARAAIRELEGAEGLSPKTERVRVERLGRARQLLDR